MITTLRARNLKEASSISIPEGFEKVNVLSWHKKDTPYYELSPYFMKTDGEEGDDIYPGIIFEGFYQASKVYPYVKTTVVKPHNLSKIVWWKYECDGEEVHFENDKVTEKYLEWQQSIFACPNPIRYPNTYGRRHMVLFSRIIKNGEEKRYNYIQARKEIYVREYVRLARKTNSYQNLLRKIKEGKNICIIEVDVPACDKKGFYKKYANEILDLNKIEDLINDPSEAFGHGLALTKALLEDLK